MEDVQGLLKRPKLYDNIDGSSELMLGCMMIGFTALVSRFCAFAVLACDGEMSPSSALQQLASYTNGVASGSSF